jgi:hypothetical protein
MGNTVRANDFSTPMSSGTEYGPFRRNSHLIPLIESKRICNIVKEAEIKYPRSSKNT